MKLHDYLKSNKIKGKDFAAQIGVDKSYVSALRRHAKWPSEDVIRRIKDATKGQVTADSFLERIEANELERITPVP